MVSDAIYPFYIGGKEKRTYKIAMNLAGAGHDVHLYTMSPALSTNPPADAGNIHFHFISRKLTMYRNGRRSLIQALRFGACVLKLIFEPFDVLDVDQIPFVPVWSSWIVCLLKRKPLIATWHEYWDLEYWKLEYGLFGSLFYWFQRVTARRPRHLVAVSEETRNNLQRAVRKEQLIYIVPNAMDFDIARQVRPSTVRSDIIFVGRLQPHKNIDLLIDAVDVIRNARPDVRCLIVGSGPQHFLLNNRVMKLDLVNNVRFLDEGETEERIFSLMKASKVFVLPSEREGFSIVTLEAMACGLPVITVDQPLNNAKSLIAETKFGSVIPSDPLQLAKAVMWWLSAHKTPELRFDLFSYSWASAADDTADIYIEALLETPRARNNQSNL